MSRRSLFVGSLTLLSVALGVACGDSSNGGNVDRGGDDTETDASANDAASKDGATSQDSAADAPTKKDAAKGDATDTDAIADAADAADAGDAGWPDCESAPSGAVTKTLPQIWSDNASAPARAWVEGLVVTAISRGGCAANQACQLYVQKGTSYASLAAGAHQAIKVFVSAATSAHFVGIQVGDVVDVSGWGWRYSLDGQSEILLQVNAALPGCMKKTGTASVTPIAATLAQLTHASYETYGPLLVSLANTSGKAQASATETFGLYPTGGSGDAGAFDAGAEIVSLSPFFMPNASFAGSPVTLSTVNAFASLVGVFGIFTPGAPDGGSSQTYLELCPRQNADIVK